jgi:hypothetical protein
VVLSGVRGSGDRARLGAGGGVHDSPAELRRIFDETAAAADAAIDRALAQDGLDTLSVRTSGRQGTPFSLRWIILHMIEEYARHNGHADMLREAVDGQVGA